MAGEEEGKESLQFSSSSTGNALNLSSLRDRVKDYIEKVFIFSYRLKLRLPF